MASENFNLLRPGLFSYNAFLDLPVNKNFALVVSGG
jgi:hypothetical protein